MKRFPLVMLALCLSFVAASSAEAKRPTFHSRADVAADAAWRLGGEDKAAAPAGSNTLTYEGNVSLNLLSGSFSALEMDVAEIRFECDNNAVSLGCAAVNRNDHLIIYGHLRTYLSCRHDATDDEAAVNLIYRRTYHACGDLTCEIWTLLSQ